MLLPSVHRFLSENLLNYFTFDFFFNIKKSKSLFDMLFNVLNWKIKNTMPSAIQASSAMYDGVDSAAGDDGMSNNPRNTREITAPNAPNTTYTLFSFPRELKNFTATNDVARNAIDTPTDDMSTIHDNAVRPSHGAANVTMNTNTIAMYGVLNLGWTRANTGGTKFARPSANTNLDDDK